MLVFTRPLQDLQPAGLLWHNPFLFCVKGKFQAFYQYAKTFNSDEFDYEDLKNSDYIFMRWKVRSCLRQALPYVVSYFWTTADSVCHPVGPLRSSFWSQTTQSKTSVELPSLDSTTSASRNPQQQLRATTIIGALNGNKFRDTRKQTAADSWKHLGFLTRWSC